MGGRKKESWTDRLASQYTDLYQFKWILLVTLILSVGLMLAGYYDFGFWVLSIGFFFLADYFIILLAHRGIFFIISIVLGALLAFVIYVLVLTMLSFVFKQ